MYVVLHDGVVENRVTLFQVVGLLAIDNLYLALHDVDELLTLVSRKLELWTLLRVDVNHERFHMTTSFLLCQWVILHVLAGINGAIAETDTAICLAILGTGNNGTQCLAIVNKGTQSYAYCTGNLNQRTQ